MIGDTLSWGAAFASVGIGGALVVSAVNAILASRQQEALLTELTAAFNVELDRAREVAELQGRGEGHEPEPRFEYVRWSVLNEMLRRSAPLGWTIMEQLPQPMLLADLDTLRHLRQSIGELSVPKFRGWKYFRPATEFVANYDAGREEAQFLLRRWRGWQDFR